MTRHYCDKCDTEITDKTQIPERMATTIEGGGKRMTVDVTRVGPPSDGLFCKYCVLDAIAQLDDRPRPATDILRNAP